MELTWFRRPGPDGPGTLNLCFNAVDLHVVHARATEPAVRTATAELDFATLLERVGALAGAMRGLGIGPGSGVVGLLDDPLDRLFLLLACLRLGAVHLDLDPVADAESIARFGPHLVATSRAVDTSAAAVVLLRGLAPEDATREVDWEIAVRAGRTDPAACVDLSPDSPAYVVGGETVSLLDLTTHDSWAGRASAALCAGGPLDLEALR